MPSYPVQNHLLRARIYPDNAGKILYVHDSAEHLRAVIGGMSSIHYHYVAGKYLSFHLTLGGQRFIPGVLELWLHVIFVRINSCSVTL